MKPWNRFPLIFIVITTMVWLACRPSPLGPVEPIGGPIYRRPFKLEVRTDHFRRPDRTFLEVKEPHKIAGGMLHLRASGTGTILPLTAWGRPEPRYHLSAIVMPPGVGESVGLAFAQSNTSQGVFFLYRPADGNLLDNRCQVSLSLRFDNKEITDVKIKPSEIEFEPGQQIKLMIVHASPNLLRFSVNTHEVARFRRPDIKLGKVGVYGRSQHADSSPAIVQFESFQIYYH